ncbi:transport protein particle component [Pseudovirgaria hyperparasitica]|uniref:Transport protein particle component n=1 Tax=Pseudovirgaria hyperparasitica TaxID=470096 RepID=A0A6A6W518_9PEZI|nr:transport protein particle component [Pseudovirgaria hyperparasitica]KAF2756151.1 transport protein particle component [Pseudovirgaria hyperparasitica]
MATQQPELSSSSTTTTDPFVSISCLDFLLIELVPMAYRIAAELSAREEDWTRPIGALNTTTTTTGTSSRAQDTTSTTGGGGGGGGGDGGTAGSVAIVDDEETREAVFYRLEMLGYRVGLGITERFSRDKPRSTDALDTIKFLCKDIWLLVFRKQIDNLKTNHRGIYVLTDNAFKPLTRMSAERGQGDSMLARAQPVR